MAITCKVKCGTRHLTISHTKDKDGHKMYAEHTCCLLYNHKEIYCKCKCGQDWKKYF